MKTIPLAARIITGVCVLIAYNAMAAAPDIQLGPDTSKLRPSKLPGYAIAMQKCAICHSADYVKYQPPGMTQVQWTAEMTKMQHTYGAPISDDEVRQIGAYLAVAYGSAKATDIRVVAASLATPGTAAASPSLTAPAGASINVQALLASNACLSCHGLNQKIVGPGYHDVAAKYKADPQAQSKLEASIRGGSAGKWGNAAMPAFAALRPEEIKALAAFVLQQ
jgi:cytochrome c551/c552